ncbi:uncharacterized protein [Physcomitrium patens]|uniref:Uncharacterized protein n=1 Tax=Physcomitrium patens TaxID=3218 RepID=A9RPP1_PHYPA|nr:uncharacterized protein LOC112283918 [Physcomitrium patens]PNR62924.1 hypothetical protein PHYPA_001349 [Physcomitrium patens]|eukprot:XP_024379084.1 uncharacterized protein LOC112283918 [Physcomitrella patens]
MADKPARALVCYGDGLMPAVKPHHAHLHQLAVSGSCGFLALRSLPDDESRPVLELAQLLDVYDVYSETACKEDLASGNGSAGAELRQDDLLPSMAERFMGTKATFIANSKSAVALGRRCGFATDCLAEDGSSSLPDASATASKALGLLGFDESSDAKEMNELVFLHLDADNGTSAECGIEFLDSLVGSVQDASKEGTSAYGRLFFVVVLGYGDAKANLGDAVPSIKSKEKLSVELASLRPRQSYTMKTGKPVEGVREEYPLLAVYNQVAVTRRDEVERFMFEDFQNRAGNLAMLVDRFLYEVAFKLWKAPKYGA